MASIGQKLETKGVIMALLTLAVLNTGCEEQIDNPVVNPSDGKTVEVTLNIGIADEVDGYDLSASSTKALSLKKGAFNAELTPTVATRATAAKPTTLYKLEIRQYDKDGNYINGNGPLDDQAIGCKLKVNLSEASDCQLVFVAWGQGSSKSLGTTTLSKAQEVTVDASVIESIKDENMNTMPYVLHLKHVNITGKGANGIISSLAGEDVRILLKRLATRLTLHWEYPEDTDYSLNQILLESIPLNYNVISKPDEKENYTYPSLLDQYTTIELTKEEIASKKYTRWIPANVRGTNNESNSALYRIKANAPTGSSYASFIAGHKTDIKKKLNYRLYLGGPAYTDFNLYGNTDYEYTISFKHKGLPVDDRRVTIIDPIPASQKNENLLPTANCFMVAPGGAFCFNPYIYSQNGNEIPNDLLQGWCKDSRIQSVKVLWQTKENGDVGDPVLGVINSPTDHTNIVDLENGNSFDDARIYCRVAPNTTGGSGLIAAYDDVDGKGKILWSWHVWVTDYAPDATGNESVDEPKKRKLKFTYNLNSDNDQLPMMDRNLGAMAGYTEVPPNPLEKSKTHGFHYEWGRKDLFPSSYTSDDNITYISSNQTKPTKGLLNLYAPDGFTFCPLLIYTAGTVTHQTAYQNPTTLYKPNNAYLWNDLNNLKTAWGGDASKTVHDPCPASWRITKITDYQSLFQSTPGVNNSVALNLKNASTLVTDGGAVLYFENTDKGRTTYIRFTGYWNGTTSFVRIGEVTLLWCRDDVNSGGSDGNNKQAGRYLDIKNNSTSGILNYSGHLREAITLRCIQERE